MTKWTKTELKDLRIEWYPRRTKRGRSLWSKKKMAWRLHSDVWGSIIKRSERAILEKARELGLP